MIDKINKNKERLNNLLYSNLEDSIWSTLDSIAILINEMQSLTNNYHKKK